MKAIIIGGSGATGKFLVKRLLQQPWISEVKVLLRKKTFSDHPKISQIIVDLTGLMNTWEYSKEILHSPVSELPQRQLEVKRHSGE